MFVHYIMLPHLSQVWSYRRVMCKKPYGNSRLSVYRCTVRGRKRKILRGGLFSNLIAILRTPFGLAEC